MYAQSDFRFLIPLQSGQRVALFDSNETFADALREEKVDVTLIADSIPDAEVFDHVVIPRLTKPLKKQFPHQFSRSLRPGGTLFVGFANRAAIDRLLSFGRIDPAFDSAMYTLGDFTKYLKNAGFATVHTYGIRDLDQPQFVVSLDQPSPGRFFFAQIFYPHSFRAAIAQKAAKAIAAIGLHRSLFKYFGVVAVKMPAGQNTND